MLDQINKWRYIPTVGYETAEKMHEHNHTPQYGWTAQTPSRAQEPHTEKDILYDVIYMNSEMDDTHLCCQKTGQW